MTTPRMKLLYVGFVGTDQSGVHRKLAEQARALRAAGVELEMLIFADTSIGAPPPSNEYSVVDIRGGGFDDASRRAALVHCRERCARFAPDLVYMRYPVYDEQVARFVREHPVVFELQTIYANEVPPHAAAFESKWAGVVLAEAAGLVAVTREILEYEQARAPRAIPGHVMPNGADASTIPFTPPALATDRIDLLCVASFYPWHGVDRLIVGFAAEPDVRDVHLHLLGDGPTIPDLELLASEAGVRDRVHFHGRIPVAQLDAWYPRTAVAIGSLAPHRVGLRELAALKHREYALRGLPMMIAGADADFGGALPWLRTVPADDSPVSPRTLRALAHAWKPEARRRQIRSWAETHVTWAVKIATLLPFLETCVAAHAARRPLSTRGAA